MPILSEKAREDLRTALANKVTADEIADQIDAAPGSVQTGEIDNGAVTGIKIASGAISSVKLASGDLQVPGAIIGYKDNATSARVKGPQAPSEGGADVQSYSGIFYNDAYAGTGTLKTRVIHGANLEMDLEVQSPHQLRIVAVDDSQTDGEVYQASKTGIVFNARADAETASPKQLIIDRVDTGTTGTANTSDVNVKASSGSVHINNGITTGALVVPILTAAQITALTPVNGMVVYNSDTSVHQGYNGTWNDLY